MGKKKKREREIQKKEKNKTRKKEGNVQRKKSIEREIENNVKYTPKILCPGNRDWVFCFVHFSLL